MSLKGSLGSATRQFIRMFLANDSLLLRSFYDAWRPQKKAEEGDSYEFLPAKAPDEEEKSKCLSEVRAVLDGVSVALSGADIFQGDYQYDYARTFMGDEGRKIHFNQLLWARCSLTASMWEPNAVFLLGLTFLREAQFIVFQMCGCKGDPKCKGPLGLDLGTRFEQNIFGGVIIGNPPRFTGPYISLLRQNKDGWYPLDVTSLKAVISPAFLALSEPSIELVASNSIHSADNAVPKHDPQPAEGS